MRIVGQILLLVVLALVCVGFVSLVNAPKWLDGPRVTTAPVR